jgi:MerR family redox-sensitive transcriptional activator SoxR
MDIDALLTIGALSERTEVAPSALRFYESEGLIHATRTPAGQRRYARATLRRVSFIRVAQQVGLSLQEIRDALASLPDNRTPNERDWHRLSTSWRPRLENQIAMLERLRDRLDSCIGCGCLSLKACALLNPYDKAAAEGPGPRYLLTAGPPRPAGDAAAMAAGEVDEGDDIGCAREPGTCSGSG